MKTLLAFALLLSAAYASITLTNTFTATSGVTVLETATQAGITNFNANFSGTPSVDINIRQGTVSGVDINSGQIAPAVHFSVNLTTGQWQANNGTSGTLTPSNLTNLNTAMRNNRNAMETMLVQNGVILGTQVPW